MLTNAFSTAPPVAVPPEATPSIASLPVSLLLMMVRFARVSL